LAHAMRSTTPTVPRRIHKGRRMSPITSSDSGRTFGARPTPCHICRVTRAAGETAPRRAESFERMSRLACESVNTGFEAGHAAGSETRAREGVRAVEAQWQDDLRIRIQQRERGRKYANDLVRPRV